MCPDRRRSLQLGRGLATAETWLDGRGRGCRTQASIGPRSCDRGNPSASSPIRTARVRLQLGRGLATAETDGPCSRGQDACRASIGPRSCDRGNHLASPASHASNIASIGPRSCDRGNRSVVGQHAAHFGASIGPRSCDRGNHAAARRRSPREAASIGPRSCDRGNELEEERRHARFSPASIGPRSCDRGNLALVALGCRPDCAASIGPRSCDRGNSNALIAATNSANELQLGRGLATAETRPGSYRWSTESARLQLGRGLATAETPAAPGARARAVPASIGPRSCDRGNSRSTGSGGWIVGPLQLGRGLATAETSRLRADSTCCRSFNWAAVLRPRKRVTSCETCRSSRRLQLGRGLATAETASASVFSSRMFSSFNWAAVLRPRKPRVRVHRSRRPCASIGPRSCDRGNSTHSRAFGINHLRHLFRETVASGDAIVPCHGSPRPQVLFAQGLHLRRAIAGSALARRRSRARPANARHPNIGYQGSPPLGRYGSDDHGLVTARVVPAAQGLYLERVHPIEWSQPEDEHLILDGVDDLRERSLHPDAVRLAQLAAEHGELERVSERFHRLVNLAKADRIRDVVRDQIEMPQRRLPYRTRKDG